MLYLLLALFFSIDLFHTPTCSNENVSREFGNNKTYSENIHGLPNIFPPYFLILFKTLIIWKNKKKRFPWQEYPWKEKEKPLNRRSKLANAADILDGKEFQI